MQSPAIRILSSFARTARRRPRGKITSRRCGPDFFTRHTLSELESWSDHDLEEAGRLTEPMRYDAASDKYRPVAWNEALAEIGSALRGLDPKEGVFYTSGRASLEASYCSRACTCLTICPTARICATRARRSLCRRPSAFRSAR